MTAAGPNVPAVLAELEQIYHRIGVPDEIVSILHGLVLHHAEPAKLTRGRATAPLKTLAEVANHFHKLSLRRSDLLGHGLVNDPAWNMLLALFAEQESDRGIATSSLCYASGVPHTTALRYLNALVEHGHATRGSDDVDQRRTQIRISPPSQRMMEGAIRNFCVPEPPVD